MAGKAGGRRDSTNRCGAPGCPGCRTAGFTLLELLVAMAVIAILAALAQPAYTQYMIKASNDRAMAEINELQPSITAYYQNNDQYPENLSDLGEIGRMTDPWGQQYQYLKIEGSSAKGKGDFRKDRFLNPLNSDYDLYSMGPDGQSQKPLTAKQSRDDIVLASNGRFIGLASNF